MTNKRSRIVVYALLLTAAFSFRLVVASLLPNDEPFDSQVYAQIARNLLEHRVYSHTSEQPYTPSLIRLPGYPLFLAGVYSVFGYGDNTPVRILQALIDTAACGLIAFLAFLWEPNAKLKRSSSIAALALASFCPFTAIYVATILPETPTIFLTVAMCVTATLAFKSIRQKNVLLLWGATGLLAGLAVLFRPDSGLFALAIGITLVVTNLMRPGDVSLSRRREEILYRFSRASYLGAMFSLAFCLVLAPWTIRNFRVFKIFQPLAPTYAAMPGEFVPRGYFSWLRTWVDDSRYIGPVLWSLDESPIRLADIPERAFDSAEEKQRVAALLEKYNHPPEEVEPALAEPGLQETPIPLESEPDQNPESEPDNRGNESEQGFEGNESDGAELSEQSDDTDPGDENASSDSALAQPVEMTPEIDAGFARIASERIARHPLRHFIWLPLKRASTLWFDTHSQFYPFEGALLPLSNLDHTGNQHFWLPLFAALTFVYTLLGIAGGWFLWQTREFISRQWLLLSVLMIFLRIGFFSTLEKPEARYVVEVFPFLSILGGIALTRILIQFRTRQVSSQDPEQ